MRLNRTKGLNLPPFTFYTLSGPNYSEGLPGNTLAEHTMQQPGRQQAKYLECPGGLYNELNTYFT